MRVTGRNPRPKYRFTPIVDDCSTIGAPGSPFNAAPMACLVIASPKPLPRYAGEVATLYSPITPSAVTLAAVDTGHPSRYATHATNPRPGKLESNTSRYHGEGTLKQTVPMPAKSPSVASQATLRYSSVAGSCCG